MNNILITNLAYLKMEEFSLYFSYTNFSLFVNIKNSHNILF